MAYADEVLADSPVAYYRMGESSGLIQDSSGNGNHATNVVGTPTYGVTGALFDDADTAISFQGVVFLVADSSSLDVGDLFTLEAWVRVHAMDLPGVICMKGTDSFMLQVAGLSNTELILVKYPEELGVVPSIVSADELWHHVVASKDGPSWDLYIDGSNATVIMAGAESLVMPNNAGALTIGAFNDGSVYYLDADLDELAIYNTKLPSARVVAHYEAGKDPDWLEVEGEGPSAISAGT